MPKKTRKKPLTSEHGSMSSSSSPAASRTVIRRYHTLIKQRVILEKQHASTETVDAQIRELGGLAVYQDMSRIGQGNDRGGGSEKVLIRWLKQDGIFPTTQKLKLLEVGALKPDNYKSCETWIDNTPIDLRSSHPAIRQQDFLEIQDEALSWDIISLSLVVNFVPDAKDRGRMLLRAHEMLKHDGLLFLALPLPCVENSRFCTFEHLDSIMRTIGFTETHRRSRQGGKMAYWLYKKSTPSVVPMGVFNKKQTIREGASRNNFCILLLGNT